MHKVQEITRLIHENFWLVMAFAFSQPVLGKVLDEKFQGEWKYLRKSFHELAEIRADRALLEMATQLRILDDAENLNDYLRATGERSFGTVTQGDGRITALHFRDMTNKIVHSSEFRWVFTEPDNPKVVCQSADQARWQKADINLLAVAALVGGLIF